MKAKDPFPFLRRSSGYLTPSEARKQQDDGKPVSYNSEETNGCNVKELDLGQANISDGGMTEISKFLERNKTLVSLNLNGNSEISPAGWERLGEALKKNTTLETLSIDYTNIGDKGIENLSKGLKENKGLHGLELTGCGLTNDGGRVLLDLVKANPRITEITVMPGNNISDDILANIRSPA